MGWEIGELESEEGGCFVVRAGDINGNSYIGFSADDLTEGVDPSEYNDEAPMIKNDLHTIVRVATHLNQALGKHENLPTWVIEKLAQTKGMLVSAMDYIVSQHEMGQKEEVPGSALAEETLPWETDQEAREREAGRKEKSAFKKPNNPNRMPRDTVKALAQKGIPKNSENKGVAEGVYSHDVERAFPGGKSTGVKTHSNKPAVVKTNKPIGTRVADIGPGGKEHNVKTDKEWDKQKGVAEEKVRLDPKCWTGKHKEGTKIKGGVRVNNCVPNESVTEDTKSVYRIGLVVTDPNHPMVSKRNDTIQKTVRVTSSSKDKAIDSAIAHYRRKGFKVHDHHYLGLENPVDEDQWHGTGDAWHGSGDQWSGEGNGGGGAAPMAERKVK